LRIPDSEGYHVCGNTLYYHDAGFVQHSLSQSIATGIECGRECKTSPYKLCTGLSIKLYPQPPFPHPAVWCAQLVYPSILPEGGVYANTHTYTHTHIYTHIHVHTHVYYIRHTHVYTYMQPYKRICTSLHQAGQFSTHRSRNAGRTSLAGRLQGSGASQ